jgi:hypothetical protein
MAAGCLVLFALPFAGTGTFLAIVVARRIVEGAAFSGYGPLAAAAIAFGLPGFGLMAGARIAKKRMDAEAVTRATNPESPWLWNPDWTDGIVRSRERGTVVGTWVFAILWSSISVLVLFFLPRELRSGNRLALIGLVFPAIGVFLLVRAIRASIRWRRFGVSELTLAKFPALPGEELRAEIRTRFDDPPDEMHVTLTSIRRTDRGGDDGVSETVLWQDERVIASHEMQRDSASTIVPVAFAIPPDATPTEREGRPSTVRWQIEAKASVTGVDYMSRFEVPVYRVPDPSAIRERPAYPRERREGPALSMPAFDPMNATVRVNPGPGGGTEIHFGAARNKGVLVSFTIMYLIFFGGMLLARSFGAPSFIVIAIGAFALLLMGLTIDAWLGTSTVEVGGSEITVRSAILGVGRTRRMDGADVRDVVVKMGMTQQQTATQSARVWYDIAIVRTSGRDVIAGRRLASRQEAEWLAATIRESLGLRPGSRKP